MKKPYRLAYNWLDKWYTALMHSDNTGIDFWIAVSRDMSQLPDCFTESEKKLYQGLISANFTYLEHLFTEQPAKTKAAAKGEI